MAIRKSKPVIFLAFANARSDNEPFLRNLPEELRRIYDTLRVAQSQGLCEVVSLANATVEQIFDTFQDAAYRDRIAIFHYGGHANSFQLLLETNARGTEPAEGKALAAFLGAQPGLQLVFLNGCSTRSHAEKLLESGIPAVIATSRSINDEVAMRFAARFYRGLASGADIERAYHEATAESQSINQGDLRTFYVVNEVGPGPVDSDHWPWEMHIKVGADKTSKWSLPDAVGNPLFGLPPLPEIDLPPKPFFYLDSFTREQALVFFGRGHQIRELYERVTDPYSAPILLLYGQTGVGKSSLLAAGLLPRLEGSYEIHYYRRDDEVGLPATLARALAAKQDVPPGEAWRQLEKETDKAVVLILDQIEETFTRSKGDSSDEFKEFLLALETIFATPATRPKGKLILGFRKEWIAEVEAGLMDRKLPHSKVFLEHLDRDGIIEAVTGITRSERLQSHFGLTMEERLPELIADDLLEDEESPIAPTLQILLTKLWDKATEENRSRPVIDIALYLKLKEEGLLVSDFLDQQLDKAKAELGVIASSGLVLDILAFHTTALGTAQQRRAEEIESEYESRTQLLRPGPVKWITDTLKDLYLLADASPDQLVGSATRLSHDILAPLVHARFEKSLLPGQKARRILENRAVDWRDDEKGGILYDEDLTIINRGETGMRAFKPEETRLLNASKRASAKRKTFNRFLKVAGVSVVLALVVFTVNLVMQRRQERYDLQLNKARDLYEKARIEWEMNRELTKSLVLVGQAIATLPDDRVDLIDQYQETAFHLSMNQPSAVNNLSDADQHSYVNGAFFSPAQDKLLLISETKIRAFRLGPNVAEPISVPAALSIKSREILYSPKPVFSSTGDWFAFLTRNPSTDYPIPTDTSTGLKQEPDNDIQAELLKRESRSTPYSSTINTYNVCAWHVGSENVMCGPVKLALDIRLSFGMEDCVVTLLGYADSLTTTRINFCESRDHRVEAGQSNSGTSQSSFSNSPQIQIYKSSVHPKRVILSSGLSRGGDAVALLVQASEKNEANLQLWDVNLSKNVFTAPVNFTVIKGFNNEFNRFLLTDSDEQTLCVYSTMTRSCESSLNGGVNGTWSSAMFAGDQSSVISISDKFIRFWNVKTGTPFKEFVVPQSSLASAVSSNSETLRLLFAPNFLQLSNSISLLTWNLTGDPFKWFRLQEPFNISNTTQVESPSIRCLTSGSKSSLAYASFTPDQKSVLMLSYQYDLPDFRDKMKLELLALTPLGPKSLWALAVPEIKIWIGSGGQYFAAVSKSRASDSIKSTIDIHEMNTGKVFKSFQVDGEVKQLAFNEDETRISVESREDSKEEPFFIEQIDLYTGNVIPGTYTRQRGRSWFSKYGDLYLSFAEVRRFPTHERVLFQPLELVGLVSTALFQQAQRVEKHNEELFGVFDQNILAIKNDPNPLLELFGRTLTKNLKQNEGWNLVVSPNGKKIGYVSKSLNQIFVEAYPRFELLRNWSWRSVYPVVNFTFTPGGNRLMVITNDGTIRALHLTMPLSPLGSRKDPWIMKTAEALTGMRYTNPYSLEEFEPSSTHDYLRARDELISGLEIAKEWDERAQLLLERLTSTN